MTDLDFRYETKFVCTARELAGVERWLLQSPAGFRPAFEDRRINNIYFDSFDYECVRANLAGVADRYKPRLRWYGSATNPETAQFEIKLKKGRVGAKRIYPLHGLNAGASIMEICRFLRKNLPSDVAAMAFDFRNPVVGNIYNRKYYVSRDQRLRVTLDSNQKYFELAGSRHLSAPSAMHSSPNIIVEIKNAKADLDYAIAVTKDFPLRIRRHSKYLMAVSNFLRVPYI